MFFRKSSLLSRPVNLVWFSVCSGGYLPFQFFFPKPPCWRNFLKGWKGRSLFFFKVAVRRRNFLRHRRNKFPKDTRTLLRFCEGQYWEDLEFLEGHKVTFHAFFFWGSWRTRLNTSIFFLGDWQSSDLPNGRGLVWILNAFDLSVKCRLYCRLGLQNADQQG